ncbi:hypothetical protein JQ604_12740 [Bradyrhizobium jicamae]|uniref:hypothetical protein n=1 Tax=Bradyrhizobium jicamae TaxID=280332 RepID=UPI001BA58929|nr:hypothetical protein [Bradyrhizobium jicamae]MBR0753053.1 hypothetical protein [Bradyrhizobium jicamae]
MESGSVPPPHVIEGAPSSVRPATDHDGFSVGISDDDDTSSRPARPVKSRRAKQPINQEADRASGQQSVDPGEDDKLKGKLTICRGCK